MISANTSPEYGNKWLLGAGGWGCDEWMQWYYALNDTYGSVKAKQQWLDAWNIGAESIITTVPLDCRSFNTQFINFLKKEGLYNDVENILSKTIATGTTVVDSAQNIVQGAADTAGFLGSNMKWIVITGAIIIIGIIILVLFKPKLA